jgi:hypothetical protein
MDFATAIFMGGLHGAGAISGLCLVRHGHASLEYARADRQSLVLSREANNPPQRLNALAGNWGIDLGPDCFGGLVAKLFGGKRLNLLGGGWGRTSKNNPLQRNEKNPFHAESPALAHHTMAVPSKHGWAIDAVRLGVKAGLVDSEESGGWFVRA